MNKYIGLLQHLLCKLKNQQFAVFSILSLHMVRACGNFGIHLKY